MKFGYIIMKGIVIAEEEQAEIIRLIYKKYIKGASMKSIASQLSDNKVEYEFGKYDWNKNRINRILKDKTYFGNENYSPIVKKEEFDEVQKITAERNNLKEYDLKEIFSEAIVPIKCDKCGDNAVRNYSSKRKNTTKYNCTNPLCKASYIISDIEMRLMIKDLLVTAEKEVSFIRSDSIDDISRLENEIEGKLQELEVDEDELRNKIYECAALQYSALNTVFKINRTLPQLDPCSKEFTKEIKKYVSEVRLNENNRIILKLKDGREISKGGRCNEPNAE